MKPNLLVAELRAKAWVYANTYRGEEIMPQLQRFELKLAELLMHECAKACEDPACNTTESPMDLIKQHFGIV